MAEPLGNTTQVNNKLNMKKTNRIRQCMIVLLLLSATPTIHAQNTIKYGDNKEAGDYKKVNGIDMYYEIYGTGKPLIFLHGNGGSIWGARQKIEYYKNHFKVIAIDSRGHGKSLDPTTQPLNYVQMANDVKVLLDSLHIDSAFVFGQSDGGILGLLLAIRYPGKIAKLATYGANIFPGKKAIVDALDDLVKDSVRLTKNANLKRQFALMVDQPHIPEQDLQKIQCPVLVISGDRDAIKLEHTLKIFNNIPNSNLFIMPGATHFGSVEKPDLFNKVFTDFLNKPFSKLSTLDLFIPKK